MPKSVGAKGSFGLFWSSELTPMVAVDWHGSYDFLLVFYNAPRSWWNCCR